MLWTEINMCNSPPHTHTNSNTTIPRGGGVKNMVSSFKRMLQWNKWIKLNTFSNNKNVKNYNLLDKFIICKTHSLQQWGGGGT